MEMPPTVVQETLNIATFEWRLQGEVWCGQALIDDLSNTGTIVWYAYIGCVILVSIVCMYVYIMLFCIY